MSGGGVAIAILAGGEARRLPRKLERLLHGKPLLLTVYDHMRGRYPVYVCTKETLAPELDAALDCPVLVDRWPGRGPLGGLATAAAALAAERIFAVAGDAPALTLDVLDRLLAAWQPGDACAVPEHDGRIEPLGALYDGAALAREAQAALSSGRYALHALVERLGARRVSMPGDFFFNVNTEADLARIGAL